MRKQCEDWITRLLARATNSVIELEQRFVDYRNDDTPKPNCNQEELDMPKPEPEKPASPLVVTGETILASELPGEFPVETRLENCRIFVDVPITSDYDYVNCLFEVDEEFGLRSQHPNGRPLRVMDSAVIPRETVRA